MGDKIYFINMIISIATENSSKTKTRTKQKELPNTWSMRSIQTLENVAHKYWSEQRWRSQPQEVRGKQQQEKQTYFSIILNCRIDWILCFTLNKTKKTEPVLSVHCREETNSSKKNIVPTITTTWDAYCLLVCPLFLTYCNTHLYKDWISFVWPGTTLTKQSSLSMQEQGANIILIGNSSSSLYVIVIGNAFPSNVLEMIW